MTPKESRYLTASRLLVEYAKSLADLDEPLKALELLKTHAPAYYRDFPTPEMKELQKLIAARMFTDTDYIETDNDDYRPDYDHTKNLEYLARGRLVDTFLEDENKNGREPFLFDLGPADFWLPIALEKKGRKFRYASKYLNSRAADQVKVDYPHFFAHQDSREANVFIAFEIIEHLHDPLYLRQVQLEHCPNAEFIMVSTPRYCFEGLDIQSEKQQHYRVYTPRELCLEVERLWPEMKWELLDNEVMVVMGSNK